MTKRSDEKQRLIRERDALREKYPPEVYAKLKEEPEDILRHSREVIRFNPIHAGELYEISYTGAPGRSWNTQ